MKDDTGIALYRKAGELGLPVGVMCFKGFGLHVKEIEALLESSPPTKVRYIVASVSACSRQNLKFSCEKEPSFVKSDVSWEASVHFYPLPAPATCRLQLVIDHFGFFLQDGVIDEAAWAQLLALSK